MNFSCRARLWLAAGLVAGQFVFNSAIAQPAAIGAAELGTNAVAEISARASKSPVELFRELLAMPPAEQKQFLAIHPPEIRRRILAKLREYESLKPNERELRLRVTELSWYLLPLLEMPRTNREAQLALISRDERLSLEERLREWDKLPAAAQKELLDNEATLRYFTQIESGTAEQKQAALQDISPARREKLESGIAQWRSLPADQRQQMLDRFNRFFDLTPREKQKALATLSEAERQQMEKILKRFNNLPPSQRDECIQAFTRFTSMSLAERQQFLKNAEKWRLMSPDERQNWRELVQTLEVGMSPLPPMVGTASNAH